MTNRGARLLLVAQGVTRLYAFVLVLGACAVTNTPQQDLAYARWTQCSEPFASLQEVDLGGRITFQFTNASERQAILQCLSDAGRTGSPLPQPVSVPLPRGD
jgi:hypothetical protein